jgi:hypothetical protein
MMAGVWLFTDNTNFAGGQTREQDPIGSVQLHARYRASPTFWVSGNANFYTGGRTTVSGERNLDLQRNSRIGITSAWSINSRHSIRLSLSRGAYTNIGADFTSVGVGYNFAWIG